MLMDFDTVEDGASTVSAVIAGGIVPAAMEMMDQLCLRGRRGLHPRRAAGRRRRGAARRGRRAAARRRGRRRSGSRAIAAEHGVRTVRIAADDAERALLWKGRKSAFGAIARIKPNYYLHDTVVPRARLPEVLAAVYEITRPPRPARAQRVPRRRRQPAPAARLRRAGAGRDGAGARRRRGDRSGVGRGRRRAQRRARDRAREARPDAADVLGRRPRRPGRAADAFDPTVWPTRARCCPARPAAATCRSARRSPRARGSDARSPTRSAAPDPVTIAGLGTRGGPVAGVRPVGAPAGIELDQPAEMTVTCGAGTMVAELDDALAGPRPVRRHPADRHGRRRAGRRAAAGCAGSGTARCATPCCRCATCRRRARSSRPVGRR